MLFLSGNNPLQNAARLRDLVQAYNHKFQLHGFAAASEEYKACLQQMYETELFVITDLACNPALFTSNGAPVLHVFSCVDNVNKWFDVQKVDKSQYQIAAIAHDDDIPFYSVFQVVKQLNIPLCLLDENTNTFEFQISDFLSINHATQNTNMAATQVDLSHLIQGYTPPAVRFQPIPKYIPEHITAKYGSATPMTHAQALWFAQEAYKHMSNPKVYKQSSSGAPWHLVQVLPGQMLRDTELKNEHAGIALVGHSDFFGQTVELEILTATNEVKVVAHDTPLSKVVDSQMCPTFERQIELLYTQALKMHALYEGALAMKKYQQMQVNRESKEKEAAYANLFKQLGIDARLEYDADGNPAPVQYSARATMQSRNVSIECFMCHTVFEFNEAAIPVGARYECKCPQCQTSLLRKRVK